MTRRRTALYRCAACLLSGMLLFAWGVWMAGSLGIPVTRTTLALVLLAIATLSGVTIITVIAAPVSMS